MPIFAVASELLWETIPVTDFGEGPREPYRIVHLVVCDTRGQAKYLAWQTDKNFDGDIRWNMPRFRTCKLQDEPKGAKGIVSDWENYQELWQHPKAIELFNSLNGF